MSISSNIFGNISSNQEIMSTPRFGYGLNTNSLPSNSTETDKIKVTINRNIFCPINTNSKETKNKIENELNDEIRTSINNNIIPMNLDFIFSNPSNNNYYIPVNEINYEKIIDYKEENANKEIKLIPTFTDKYKIEIPYNKKENFIELDPKYISNDNSKIKDIKTDNNIIKIFYKNNDVEILNYDNENNESHNELQKNNLNSNKYNEDKDKSTSFKFNNNDLLNSNNRNKSINDTIELPTINLDLFSETNSMYPNDYTFNQNEYAEESFQSINNINPYRINRRKIMSEVPLNDDKIMNNIIFDKYNYDDNVKISIEKEKSELKLKFINKYIHDNDNKNVPDNNDIFNNNNNY